MHKTLLQGLPKIRTSYMASDDRFRCATARRTTLFVSFCEGDGGPARDCMGYVLGMHSSDQLPSLTGSIDDGSFVGNPMDGGRKEPFNLCVWFFPKLSVNSCTQLPDSFLALWVGVGGCPAAIHCSAQPRAAAWVKNLAIYKVGRGQRRLYYIPRFAAGTQC